MAFLGALFFGFVPAFLFAAFLYWLDRYEKEPKILLGAVFFWGAFIAAGGAFLINTALGIGVYLFTGSEWATDLTTAILIAPFVEEILKGLAVLIVFLAFRHEFDSILDGMIYAGVTALGFTAAENAFYIYDRGFSEGGWEGFWFLVFVRVILVGWQHPFYTAFTGIGFAVARMSRSRPMKVLAPLLGLSVAMFTHAMHNALASILQGLGGLLLGTLLDWSGWFLMFLFALWMIRHEGLLLRRQLAEEVKAGLIAQTHLNIAASPFGSIFAALSALFRGRFRHTARFYQALGELAHKKEQVSRLGDEYHTIVGQLRQEIATLRPYVPA